MNDPKAMRVSGQKQLPPGDAPTVSRQFDKVAEDVFETFVIGNDLTVTVVEEMRAFLKGLYQT